MLTRRHFVAGTIAVPAIADIAAAQSAGVSFMSFTYAEQAGKAAVEQMGESFKTASGTPVELIGSAWGDVQRNLLLRVRSNTAPSTVQVQERWMPNFNALPNIVDFNETFGADRLAAAFDANALGMGKVGTKQLGIPLMTGSIGMVANREVLQKAGVGALPRTIDEFRAACLKVRDSVPNSVPYAMATKNNNSIPLDFLLWVWAHGGRIIDDSGAVVVNSAAGKAALAFVVGLMKDRLSAAEIDRPDSRRLQGQGAAAFYFDPPQARVHLRAFSGRGAAFDPAIAPMATPMLSASDKPVSIAWGHMVIAFGPGGKLAGDAPTRKWIEHIMSDKVQLVFPIDQSGLPVTKAALASPIVTGDSYLKDWSAAAGTTRINEIGIWPNAAEITTAIGEEVQATMLGQKTADAAIVALQSRLEAAMAKKG